VLVSLDGAGNVGVHLPPAGSTRAASLEVGREVRLPFAYRLDRAPAFERFFLVTATESVLARRRRSPPRALSSPREPVRRAPSLSRRASADVLPRAQAYRRCAMRRSALVVLLSLLVLAFARRPPTPRLRRYLVVAGVDDGGAGRRAPALRARRRARRGRGALPARRRRARRRRHPRRASPAALLAGLRQAAARVKEGAADGVQRQLLFYYSGHSDEEGLLLGGQRLPTWSCARRIEGVPAEVRVAILDSCASGAFTRLKGGTYAAPFMLDTSARMTGHAYLTSTLRHRVGAGVRTASARRSSRTTSSPACAAPPTSTAIAR
jgi:hypothetical protein